MFRLSLKLFLFLLSAAILASTSVHAETVRVAVAANFYPVMKKLSESFEDTSQHRVDLVVGSSGKLAAQIVQGAPFDLFLSADIRRPTELEKRDFVLKDSRVTYAKGRLALLSTGLDKPLDVLRGNRFERIAIANPKLAPYGRAASESIEAMEIGVRAEQFIFGENVSQAFHFFKTGHVDLAFVALSQVMGEDLDESDFLVIPEELYSPIDQQMVLLNQKIAASEVYAYLLSDEAQKVISQSGYRSGLSGDEQESQD